MKRAYLLLLLLIHSVSVCGQSYTSFIRSYKEEYAAKKHIFKDTSFFYIPCVTNFDYSYGRFPDIKQQRDSLFAFLDKPIISNDIAIKKSTGELYTYPMGLLYNDGFRDTVMVKSLLKNWWYYEYIYPLYIFIRSINPDYVFSISAYEYYKETIFWMIFDEQLFILKLDLINGSYYPIEADTFIQFIANDLFFLPHLDYSIVR